MAPKTKRASKTNQTTLNCHTDIFLSNHFLDQIPCLILCLCSRNDSDFKFNAIFRVKDQQELVKLIIKVENVIIDNFFISIGIVGDNTIPNNIKNKYTHFTINISSQGHLFVSSYVNHNVLNTSNNSVTLITYKTLEILDCDYLDVEHGDKPSSERMIDFLNYTFVITKTVTKDLTLTYTNCSIKPCIPYTSNFIKQFFIAMLLAIIKPVQKLPLTNFHKIFTVTATGRQLATKLSDINDLRNYLQEKEISLKCCNLIAAIITDIVCGIFLMSVLRDYLNAEEIFASILEMTEVVVNELQTLLNWLMGVPAGLKLNRPLNIVLGRFFLYHIYLWKTYIVVLKPFLLIALENSTIVGVFGASFLLSFASDFISLATIHIYCFYGYAARIYNLNITGLIALWRLFCGKKWNPLRNRVDSYTYDVQQLFIGTLMFTVLIFLLPTVVVYYVVFTMLRLAVLSFLLGIGKLIKLINTIPIYVIYLRLISHHYIKGDIYFEVLSNESETVHLYMESKPSSWSTLVSKTKPDDKDNNHLTWVQLCSSLLRGKIIYPL